MQSHLTQKYQMTKYIEIIITMLLSLCLIACTSEDTTQSISTKGAENSSKKNNKSENNIVSNDFELASNGLEYKVIEKYEMDYYNGDVSSVVVGNLHKMDSGKNRIFLEARLSTPQEYSLNMFEDKHPSFLNSEKNDVIIPDSNLLKNTKINSKIFDQMNSQRFFDDSAFENSGDLLLILSKTFHSKKAYFVHAWEISKGKSTFIVKRNTYKFNSKGILIDESFMNHSFNSNSNAEQFLNTILQ